MNKGNVMRFARTVIKVLNIVITKQKNCYINYKIIEVISIEFSSVHNSGIFWEEYSAISLISYKVDYLIKSLCLHVYSHCSIKKQTELSLFKSKTIKGISNSVRLHSMLHASLDFSSYHRRHRKTPLKLTKAIHHQSLSAWLSIF